MKAPANKTYIIPPDGKLRVGQDAVTTLPAWLAGKPLNEWFAIPSTSGADGTAIDAYNGFALNQTTGELFIALAGGHDDSGDNRVSSINLLADVAAWKSPRRKNPTPVPELNYCSPYCLDGVTPSARHTRYGCIYSPQRNRLILLCTNSYWCNTGSSTHSNAFDLATNTWDPPGTIPNTKLGNSWAHSIDDQGNIWTRLEKWLTATNTFVDLPSNARFPDGPVCFDPVRRQMFQLVRGNNQDGDLNFGFPAKTVSLDMATVRTITFNPSAAWTEFQTIPMNYTAMTYDPDKDVFYYYYGKSTYAGWVYVIKPNAGTVWDMTRLAVGPGSVVPAAAPSAGIQNRFQYVESLKGIVMLPQKTANLYFMRTS